MTQGNRYARVNVAQLEEIARWLQSTLCMPFAPSLDKLIRLSQDLGLPKNPDRDRVKFALIGVDLQPDFCQPLTVSGTDLDVQFILFNGIHNRAMTFPAHMQKRIRWMNLQDYDPTNYDNVWGGQLYVPEAHWDLHRGIKFRAKMMPYISLMANSADKHPPVSIWDQIAWYARTDGQAMTTTGQVYNVSRGQYPQPFTVMVKDSIYNSTHNPNGLWTPIPGWAVRDDWAWHYVSTLWEQEHDKPTDEQIHLIIWPPHCFVESYGSMIDQRIQALNIIHSIARGVYQKLYFKGVRPESENYGIYAREVPIPGDPDNRNTDGLNLYQKYDYIFMDGQAWTNCFMRTVQQFVANLMTIDPNLIKKVILLSNGSSPIPGLEKTAERIFADMVNANNGDGLKIMTYKEAEAFILSMAA